MANDVPNPPPEEQLQDCQIALGMCAQYLLKVAEELVVVKEQLQRLEALVGPEVDLGHRAPKT
jgi:hypothetical protein